jgi:hypothetical protein
MSRRILSRAIVLFLAAGAVFVLWPRPALITHENMTHIREGMPRAEVERILGGLPGDYRTAPTFENPNNPRCGGEIDPQASHIERQSGIDRYYSLGPDNDHFRDQGFWFGDEGFVSVTFTGGVVESRYFEQTEMKEQGPFDNFVWRARRQWGKWFPE